MLFQVNCLGSLHIAPTTEAAPIGKLNQKTRAILAYLAVTNQPHSRQKLYGWFCQNARDPAGTLRWHLSQIRRHLSPDLLEVTRQTAVLNPNAYRADFQQLQTAVDTLPTISIDDLTQAATLYRGEFLTDINIRHAPEFDLWLVKQRSYWQRLFEQAARVLVRRHIKNQQYDSALAVTQKILQQNPLLETVHATLVWLYAKTGHRAAALQQAEQCRTLLWDELAVEPTAVLQKLHQAIEQNGPLPSIYASDDPEPKTAVSKPSRFIGRTAELAQLAKRSATGHFVALITGSAGSGKTQLVREFRRRSGTQPMHTGRCFETTRNMPYHPWLAILEQQIRLLGKDAMAQLAPYWRQQLGVLLPELGETAASPNQQQLFRAVVHLLTEADLHPPLIFIDDLQWADEASLQLFQYVAQSASVRLIATIRTEETADYPALLTLLSDLERLPHYDKINLLPFNEGEAIQLIESLSQPSSTLPPAQICNQLLIATGGNPLYMTEILQELQLDATTPVDFPTPPSLNALIGRRLGQLPENGRQVIESLAILDQPAEFEVAQLLSGRSEDETITAVDKGLHWRLLQLQAQNRIDFSHSLMRTAVLNQITPIRQQRLHLRAANLLTQQQADAATLAYHWGKAGNQEYEGNYALIAAENATQQYAIDEAIRFYRRAIKCLTDSAKKLNAMRQLGRLYQRISDWDSAQRILTEGLEAASPRTTDEAHFQILLGQLYSRQSHYQRALNMLQVAYQTSLANESASLIAQAVGSIGIIHYFRDEYDQSLACYEEALAIVQEQEDEENTAVWSSNIANILMRQGKHTNALSYLQQAVTVQKRLGNQEQTAVALGNIGNSLTRLGQYESAAAHHLEAVQIRHEWGDKAGVATNLKDLGIDYADVGLHDAALTCFWQALTLDIELGRRDACGIVLGFIGRMLVRQDGTVSAHNVFKTTCMLLRLTHSRYYLCNYLLDQIDLLWPQEQWKEIEALLNEVGQIVQEIEEPDLLFQYRLTAVRLQTAQQKITHEEAIVALQNLLTEGNEWQQAAIGYAIWQIDPSQERWRRETAVAYQHLFDQVPKFEYRQRYLELTGEALITSLPSLPDPPHLFTPPANEVTPFLEKIQTFLQ